MNRWATGFLLVAAVAAVVCAIVFVPLNARGGKAVGSALFDFDPDDISQIKITNGDDVVEFRRTEDGWYIGPEPKDRASVDAVRRLFETALSTPILDKIDAGEIGGQVEAAEFGADAIHLGPAGALRWGAEDLVQHQVAAQYALAQEQAQRRVLQRRVEQG